MSVEKKLLDFLEYSKTNKNILEFINAFWGIKPTKKDIDNLKLFSEVIKLRSKGLSSKEVSDVLNKPSSTIDNWIYNVNLPIIIRIFENFNELNKPNNGKWLSLNSTRGGLFTGPWICVPNKINNYKDIQIVINQLNPSSEMYKKVKQFEIKIEFLKENKELLFAYLSGIMIGDAGKHGFQRQNRFMRRISLKLSKKYETNERLGEFVGLCMNSLGLRYSRVNDVPPSKKNKDYFYSWNSQSSLLISWMFEVCLGLRLREKTTYHPIKADWILKTPRKFRIWFLQGVADSDGFIDINTFKAGIVSKPNAKFIQEILASLNIKSTKDFLHRGSLDSVRFNLKDAYKLPLFNKYVESYRYNLMKKLVQAKRFSYHWPNWLAEEVDNYIKHGLSSTKIMHIILNKYNIVVRSGGIGKRIRKFRMSEGKKAILGVESTAL